MQDDTELVPVIGYIRVSMMHEEAISPELQRTAIEDWARRRGRRVVDWVTELDKTGRNFQRKIMRVIERVEAGEAREIAVWKYSRFGRNRHGCAINLARIEKAGGQLQSATEEVDARTAVGKLTRGMLMEIAAFESDRAGEQWGEARAHRVAAGLHDVGRAKFGYVRMGRVPDPERPGRTRRDLTDPLGERYEHDLGTGPVLRDMYLAYTAGEKFAEIAQRLNLAEVWNTYGRRWSWDTVRDVLDSGWGAGYLRVHAADCRECAEPSRCRNKDFLPAAHKPVISEAEWQAYLKRRAQVAARPPRARSAVYSLTSLVLCGHCGSTAAVLRADGRNRQHRLRCSRWTRLRDCPGGGRYVPYPVAENAVREWLQAEGVRLDGTEAVAAAARAARASEEQLAAELARIDRRLAKAVRDQYLEEGVPDEVWADVKAGLLAEREPVVVALEAARQRGGTDPAEVLPVIRSLAAEWETLEYAGLRDTLARLISSVVVWREDADGEPVYRARVFPVWDPEWEGPGHSGIPASEGVTASGSH